MYYILFFVWFDIYTIWTKIYKNYTILNQDNLNNKVIHYKSWNDEKFNYMSGKLYEIWNVNEPFAPLCGKV